VQRQDLLKVGKGEIRRRWEIVLPSGIGGNSLTFTAAFPKYWTLRAFGLKHNSASIRYVCLFQVVRYIFRVSRADLSLLFSQELSSEPYQHSLHTTCRYRAAIPALTTVTNALVMYPDHAEITRTVSSDPIPRHYAAPQ
jgi:hypothetical protein